MWGIRYFAFLWLEGILSSQQDLSALLPPDHEEYSAADQQGYNKDSKVGQACHQAIIFQACWEILLPFQMWFPCLSATMAEKLGKFQG